MGDEGCLGENSRTNMFRCFEEGMGNYQGDPNQKLTNILKAYSCLACFDSPTRFMEHAMFFYGCLTF